MWPNFSEFAQGKCTGGGRHALLVFILKSQHRCLHPIRVMLILLHSAILSDKQDCLINPHSSL